MGAATRVRIHLIAAPLIVLLSAVSAQGALMTFNSRALFNAAAPGLPVETFESGLVGAASVTTCTGPLSSAAGSACFAAGALLPGVTYSSTSGSMALLGAGFPGVGNTSKVLGPNVFVDTFNLTFTGATAVGFDVLSGFIPGNVMISIFSQANQLLGSSLVFAPAGGTFFGVLSDTDLIGRINIASQTSSPGELVDNVAFGLPGAAEIPEPSTWLLIGIGLPAAIRRRRR